jgi:hypothetical protein
LRNWPDCSVGFGIGVTFRFGDIGDAFGNDDAGVVGGAGSEDEALGAFAAGGLDVDARLALCACVNANLRAVMFKILNVKVCGRAARIASRRVLHSVRFSW